MQPNEPQVSNDQTSQPLPPEPTVINPTPPAQPAAASETGQPAINTPVQAETITPPAIPMPIPMPDSISNQPAASAPTGPAMTTPQPFIAGTSNSSGGSKKKPLIIGGAALVLVVIIILGLFMTVFGQKITSKNISDALQASDTIDSDMSDLSSGVEEIQSATSKDEVSSKISLINTKLADAQKQYAIIKKSPVQHDKTVHQKFSALDSKWGPFLSYIQDSSSDYSSFQPIFIQLRTDLDAATKDSPTSMAELGGYLTKLKDTLDASSTKAGSLKLKITENQKAVTSLQTFLDTASKAVAKAQTDLAAGKDGFTVEDDLFSVDDAETTLDTSLSSLDSQISDHEKQVDPQSAFTGFQSALEDLQQKTDK